MNFMLPIKKKEKTKIKFPDPKGQVQEGNNTREK